MVNGIVLGEAGVLAEAMNAMTGSGSFITPPTRKANFKHAV